jgi:hypothetical protein
MIGEQTVATAEMGSYLKKSGSIIINSTVAFLTRTP